MDKAGGPQKWSQQHRFKPAFLYNFLKPINQCGCAHKGNLDVLWTPWWRTLQSVYQLQRVRACACDKANRRWHQSVMGVNYYETADVTQRSCHSFSFTPHAAFWALHLNPSVWVDVGVDFVCWGCGGEQQKPRKQLIREATDWGESVSWTYYFLSNNSNYLEVFWCMVW